MPYKIILRILLPALCLSACTEPPTQTDPEDPYTKGTFGYDLRFLKGHDSVLVLQRGDAQVIVSPRFQGKVFTSTAGGPKGPSFGWINYKAFSALPDPHMNAYGGENRFWLGPEGGPFSLFFPKGAEMTFTHWKTPPPIDTEPWTVAERSDTSVVLQKDMKLTNYAGTPLSLSVHREVTILDPSAIQALATTTVNDLRVVGYRTHNRITNTGSNAWTEQTGAPCIWMLDMFNPSPRTVIILPYDSTADKTKVATTDYFGEIPAERIRYRNATLLFRADGNSRGKLGIGPRRARPVAGSYDAVNGVLTLTFFDVDKKGRYLNQEWTTTKPPFDGDAVNAYNDGPLEDGNQMGPFYEIESVSPAAFLAPGASLTH
ncbi:MAG TPA: DUF6786 family protein, partial [Chitinophagaceae bacterium]|nr:DUF6786 family protein [Chitinophagaceae bacterium]